MIWNKWERVKDDVLEKFIRSRLDCQNYVRISCDEWMEFLMENCGDYITDCKTQWKAKHMAAKHFDRYIDELMYLDRIIRLDEDTYMVNPHYCYYYDEFEDAEGGGKRRVRRFEDYFWELETKYSCINSFKHNMIQRAIKMMEEFIKARHQRMKKNSESTKSNNGKRNSGSQNNGDWNSGDWNDGHQNSGNCNVGGWNSGGWNIGDRNSGSENIGNCNSGKRNKGDYNSGDWNKCDFSNGCFNTISPKIRLFNKPSEWTYRDWRESKAYGILLRAPLPMKYIELLDMTDEERKSHPEANITYGFLKKTDASEMTAWWDDLDNDEKEIIMSIPNFDKKIFKEITRIDVDK